MFKRFRIRTKLAVALAVPLVALVVIAGLEAVTATAEANDIRSQTELARASLGPGSVVTAVQNERNFAGVELLGLSGAIDLDVKSNEEARAATDAALDALRAEIDRQSTEVREAYAPTFEALQSLDELRNEIDAFAGTRDLSAYDTARGIFDRYSAITEQVFDTTSSIAAALDDADLRNGVVIIDASARQSEATAQIVRWVLLSQVTGTADEPASRQAVTTWVERSVSFERTMFDTMIGTYEPAREGPLDTGADSKLVAEARSFIQSGEADINVMLGEVNATDASGQEIATAADLAAGILDDRADQILDDAVLRQRLFVALAGAMVLVAIVVTWVASRSITRPLRSLRSQAEEMATERLPRSVQEILETPPGEDVLLPAIQPIRISTRDEVSEVADALNTVQANALDLAVEQAVLRRNIADSFVNLGRRNQNLLNRQLEFITDLERNESDPDSLEGLFRLDHLATRMRRNAESLLVLAGVEPPRQWSAPVRVADVVRAALGEVEEYQRVVVRHLEPAAVTGSAAADVAHVLAELIENALSFSPPEQSVEVRGRLVPAGYTLAITDNGLGMSDDDLARANRRLAGEESFTVAPSRYLGHYVAGHLAARHGVEVELQDSPAGGITARVDLPMGAMSDDPAPMPAAERPRREPSAPEPEAPPVRPAEPPAPDLDAGADPTGPAVTAAGLPRRTPVEAPADPVPGDHDVPLTEPTATLTSAPTPSGLARRVPGAQRPDTTSFGDVAQPAAPPAAPARANGHDPTDPGPVAEPPRSTPDDVYSFLASFNEGVSRGLADSHGSSPDVTPEGSTDHEEDR